MQTCVLETKVSGLESTRVRLIKVLLFTRVVIAKVLILTREQSMKVLDLSREPCMKDLVWPWSRNKLFPLCYTYIALRPIETYVNGILTIIDLFSRSLGCPLVTLHQFLKLEMTSRVSMILHDFVYHIFLMVI